MGTKIPPDPKNNGCHLSKNVGAFIFGKYDKIVQGAVCCKRRKLMAQNRL